MKKKLEMSVGVWWELRFAHCYFAMLWPFGVACGERIHVYWLHFQHCIA